MRERPFLGHLDLRGSPREPAFLTAAERALGIHLPLEPNTVAESASVIALWLGPDEWWVLTAPDREADVERALRQALAGIVSAVTDVSGGHTVVRVQGERARDVLQKGCGLDLDPRTFGPGRCASTNFAKAAVVIRSLDDSRCYELIVRRSFAEYTALWLRDAAVQYGVTVLPPLVGPVRA
jgi:sarcosine oxidase subunit gamma